MLRKRKNNYILSVIVFSITILAFSTFDNTLAQNEITIQGYVNAIDEITSDGKHLDPEFYLFDYWYEDTGDTNELRSIVFYLNTSTLLEQETSPFDLMNHRVAVTGTVNPNQDEFDRILNGSIVLDVEAIEVQESAEKLEIPFTRPWYMQREFMLITEPFQPFMLNLTIENTSNTPSFLDEIIPITHDNPSHPTGPAVIPSVQSVAILAKFNNILNEPYTQSTIQNSMFSGSKSLSNYWDSASKGKLVYTGFATPWITLNDKSSYDSQNVSPTLFAIASDIVSRTAMAGIVDYDGPDDYIQNDSLNFHLESGGTGTGDDVDHIAIMLNDCPQINGQRACSSWGFYGPLPYQLPYNPATGQQQRTILLLTSFISSVHAQPSFQNGVGVPAHELGHTFGWRHTPPSTYFGSGLPLTFSTYSDPWSVMSGENDRTNPAGPIAFHINKAGWIDSNQINQVSQGQFKIFDLTILSQPTQLGKYAMGTIQISPANYYTIEARSSNPPFDYVPNSEIVLMYEYKQGGHGTAISNPVDRDSPVSIVYVKPPSCVSWSCLSDMGLKSGESFTDDVNKIKVKVLSVSGNSITVAVGNSSVPSEPTLHPLSTSASSITLTWDPPVINGGDNIIEYEIKRKSQSGQFMTIGTVPAGTLTYTDNNVNQNIDYTYAVAAKNSIGTSSLSNTRTTQLITTSVPGTPIDLVVTLVTDSEIHLDWNPPQHLGVPPLTGYEITRKNVDTGSVVPFSVTNSEYEDSGLMSDTYYQYSIYSKNSIGNSATPATITQKTDGGCLIATAAFGSELAPQVQFLREVRDNTVMSTSSGAAFMTGFNQLYYSFSPTIADWERQNPAFQEAVRAFITPMISTLSIMTLADSGSEMQVLTFGALALSLNVGLYIIAPTFTAIRISKYIGTRKNSTNKA